MLDKNPKYFLQTQRPDPEPECIWSNLSFLSEIKGFAQSLWLKQAGKVRDARYIWFAVTAQRMIHWWCSWSARAHRGTLHLLSLCPTASKPFLLSGTSPLWIHLVTKGEEKVLAQQNPMMCNLKTLEMLSKCGALLMIVAASCNKRKTLGT